MQASRSFVAASMSRSAVLSGGVSPGCCRSRHSLSPMRSRPFRRIFRAVVERRPQRPVALAGKPGQDGIGSSSGSSSGGGAPSEGSAPASSEPSAPRKRQDPGLVEEGENDFGSEAWRRRPSSMALPNALRSPGAWFCLAGVMKVLFLMYTNTPVSRSLSIFGLPPVFGAYLTLIPFAIALGLFAKYCVENNLQKSRWFLPAALLCTTVVLALSSRGPFAQRSPQRLRASTATVALSSSSTNTATVSVTSAGGSSSR